MATCVSSVVVGFLIPMLMCICMSRCGCGKNGEGVSDSACIPNSLLGGLLYYALVWNCSKLGQQLVNIAFL